MNAKKALVLDGQSGHAWIETLYRATASLGRSLDVTGLGEIDCTSWRDYDLVIIDAGSIDNLRAVIFYIRRHNVEAKIVVFATAPEWKQAREAMLAGAVDYAQKSLDDETIHSILEKNLGRRVPLWQPLSA